MMLLNLKTKHILLIVVIYQTIGILGFMLILPISEYFFFTEITYNFMTEITGVDWAYNFFNFGIFILAPGIFWHQE